jgi:defect-in-organelle-trafficking protein DotC
MIIRLPLRSKLLLSCALSGLLLLTSPAFAQYQTLPNDHAPARSGDPADLSFLQERDKTTDENGRVVKKKTAFDQEKELALRIRQDSMKEAARSYGARGGLAWRTHQIMIKLDENAPALDKTFNFRRLLITAPSNLLIEPPVINEALNAFVVSGEGSEAAVSDAVYKISRNARIVAAPRHWREYLERSWSDVESPPDILLPETVHERKNWRLWVAEGWQQGIVQADDTFQSDLNRLTADFEGMIRYRNLLAQGKVSAPYAVMVDRGVTGGGSEMRVGDRAVRISGQSQFINQSDIWQPPQRQ